MGPKYPKYVFIVPEAPWQKKVLWDFGWNWACGRQKCKNLLILTHLYIAKVLKIQNIMPWDQKTFPGLSTSTGICEIWLWLSEKPIFGAFLGISKYHQVVSRGCTPPLDLAIVGLYKILPKMGQKYSIKPTFCILASFQILLAWLRANKKVGLCDKIW